MPLHIVFSPSSVPTLSDALHQSGQGGTVIGAPDDLSFGPIDPPDFESRARWAERELGRFRLLTSPSSIDAFWNTATSAMRPVAWMSRRSASDYANFLHWLWRMGDAPCDIVDLTEAPIVAPRRTGAAPDPVGIAICLHILSAESIVLNTLWERARPLSFQERAHYHHVWTTLRAENAPLRVLRDGALVSAPIDAFDGLILSFVKKYWGKAAYPLGAVLGEHVHEGWLQTNDAVLAARIRALVAAGRLGSRGDPASMRTWEIRISG